MITYVRLQNFRSYTDGSFEFDPGVNIVIGPNASGKTTIIEAVLLAYQGKSFKASDRELRRYESEWTRIDIGLNDGVRTVKIQQKTPETLNKTYDIDGRQYKRLMYNRVLPVVLFEPNDLLLFSAGPEGRRVFIDTIISQIQPNYRTTLQHYKRVLSQRNALLKQQNIDNKQLFVWNLRLSELAGKIVAERAAIVEQLNAHISKMYNQIAQDTAELTFEYQTKIPLGSYESSFLALLERSLDRDVILGFTSHGPHREDIVLRMNGALVNEVASRGEIRSILLVLKMIEAQFIEDTTGVKPLLLFDDVFSELDGKRRQALVSFLKSYQSIITTTDADVVLAHFTDEAKVIPL